MRVLLVSVFLLLATAALAQEPEKPKLVMPTVFFLTASAVDWATASPACQIGCQTRTGLLPFVSDARVSVPIGLGLDAGVLWLTTKVITPRWPKVAEGLLYVLTIVHAVSAAEHLIDQRDWNRRSASVAVTFSVP
jgi:hypothetical protein